MTVEISIRLILIASNNRIILSFVIDDDRICSYLLKFLMAFNTPLQTKR